MARDDRPHPRKPMITSDGFDASAMLAKALRGDYPRAGLRSKHRAEEIAYWRGRAGLPAEADPAGESPAAAPPPDDDEAFLALPPAGQRSLIHSYLLSEFEPDFWRGAHLCALAGLRLPAESHEAWHGWLGRIDAWQRRQRLAALGVRREALRGGLLSWEGD